MKLKFGKDANGEFTASEMTDKGPSSFSYISMLKTLMNKDVFEVSFEDNILAEERQQINTIIEKIKTIAKPNEENQAEATEQF